MIIPTVAHLRRQGIPHQEAYERIESLERRLSGGISEQEVSQCVACYHYRPMPQGCWLGVPGRENPNCLAGSRQLAQRRLGKLPPCAFIRRRRKAFPSPLRVGLLTPTLWFGGAERWVAALARGFDRGVCDVVGVALRDAYATYPAIENTVSQRCPVFHGSSHFAHLAAQCDVLITWGIPDLSPIAHFAQRGGRVIIVGHGHCEWTKQCIASAAWCTTDWVAVSRHARQSFPAPAKVTVIHNGIDTDRCEPTRSRDEVRAVWGAKSDEILVGYVGRLSGEKRPLAAIEAAAALGPPYRGVLVGGGPATEYWLAEARKLDGRVIYQPPVENVGDVYRALDCFLLASPAEGFSLALAEAWYCGCPAVATPVGATELLEEHGPLFTEVPVGAAPRQLADAVHRALAPENRPMVERAKTVVAQHYTAAAMCRRWERYLLARPAGNPQDPATRDSIVQPA